MRAILLLIWICTAGLHASVPLFMKPQGFHSDGSHNQFFSKFDSNKDGLLSRAEFTSSLGSADDVFDYLVARRKLVLAMRNTSFPLGPISEDLTYSDFMWFYRESSLFENRSMIPPPHPERLYSFPSWPGMKAKPISEESRDVSPNHFWTQYVLAHKAVIIRNALEGSRALKHWSDPEYLIKHFGDLEAKIEHRFEARGDSLAGKVTRSGRASIRDIVEGRVDGYVVSVVPQPMAWDVEVPGCVLCGSRERKYLDISDSFSFMTEVEETSLWISRGKTRSQFHYDKENTFNCLVSGKPKQWVILDTRRYGDRVPWVRSGGYNVTNDLDNSYTDWVGVNVDGFDLNLHSYLEEAKFETVTQNPGDCVFLPFSMLHYAGHLVEDDTLQVAVSFMWLPETSFNEEKCPQSPPVSVPLAAFDTVWYYSGFGAVPQGHHDPRQLRRVITPEPGVFDRRAIVGFISPVGIKTAREQELLEIVQLMDLVEQFSKKRIEVPLDLWLQLSTAVDLNGLGCNFNETYIPRPLEEMDKMFAVVTVF